MFISDRTMKLLVESGLPADKLVELLQSLRADEEAFAPARTAAPKVEAPEPAPERVWVYVMVEDHPNSSLVKVGISKNPDSRRAQLEKEVGLNLHVTYAEGPFSRSEAREVERLAHEALADVRHRGEWFHCTDARATTTVFNISRRGRA